MILFFLWPILELLFWIRLSHEWGWSGNVLEIILSAILGVFLIKRGGWQRLSELQGLAKTGQSPASSLLQALCFILGGFLLILPGVMTDFVGLLLVLPFTRGLMSSLLARSWPRTRGVWVHVGGWPRGWESHRTPPASEDVIEVEAVEIKEHQGPVLGRK